MAAVQNLHSRPDPHLSMQIILFPSTSMHREGDSNLQVDFFLIRVERSQFAFHSQKVSLWRVKSSGIRQSKIYKSLLGVKGLTYVLLLLASSRQRIVEVAHPIEFTPSIKQTQAAGAHAH